MRNHRARWGAVVAAAALVGLAGAAGCGNQANEPAPLDESSEQGGGGGQDGGGDGAAGGDDADGDADQGDAGGGGSKGDTGEGKQGPPEPVDGATASELESLAVKFMKAYDQGARTGDFGAFDALYTDACETCVEYSGNLKEIYQNGGRIEGGAYLPEMQASVDGKEADGRVRVTVEGTASAYTNYDSDGKVIGNDEEKKENQVIWFQQAEGAWRAVWWVVEGE